MNKYSVIVQDCALDDIVSTRRYIANELLNPALAKAITDKIFDVIDSLQDMPERYAAIEGINTTEKVRRAISGHNSIYYTIDNTQKEVSVIAVLHGHRDYAEIIDNRA